MGPPGAAASFVPGGGHGLLPGQARSMLQGQGVGGTQGRPPVLQSHQGIQPGQRQGISFPQWTPQASTKFHGHVQELGDLIQPRPGPSQEDQVLLGPGQEVGRARLAGEGLKGALPDCWGNVGFRLLVAGISLVLVELTE